MRRFTAILLLLLTLALSSGPADADRVAAETAIQYTLRPLWRGMPAVEDPQLEAAFEALLAVIEISGEYARYDSENAYLTFFIHAADQSLLSLHLAQTNGTLYLSASFLPRPISIAPDEIVPLCTNLSAYAAESGLLSADVAQALPRLAGAALNLLTASDRDALPSAAGELPIEITTAFAGWYETQSTATPYQGPIGTLHTEQPAQAAYRRFTPADLEPLLGATASILTKALTDAALLEALDPLQEPYAALAGTPLTRDNIQAQLAEWEDMVRYGLLEDIPPETTLWVTQCLDESGDPLLHQAELRFPVDPHAGIDFAAYAQWTPSVLPAELRIRLQDELYALSLLPGAMEPGLSAEFAYHNRGHLELACVVEAGFAATPSALSSPAYTIDGAIQIDLRTVYDILLLRIAPTLRFAGENTLPEQTEIWFELDRPDAPMLHVGLSLILQTVESTPPKLPKPSEIAAYLTPGSMTPEAFDGYLREELAPALYEATLQAMQALPDAVLAAMIAAGLL